MPRIATIGVSEFTLSTFLEQLRAASIAQLIDVRQRRGVRGSEYAWASSRRLQASLVSAGIEYRHYRELAPTTEMRQLQYPEDARQVVGKRNRRTLAESYVLSHMPGAVARHPGRTRPGRCREGLRRRSDLPVDRGAVRRT